MCRREAWRAIRVHEEFQMLLADRAQKYFFNNGMLTTDRVRDRIDQLAEVIRLPLIAETARWDASYTPSTWETALASVRTSIVSGREAIVIQQLRDAGLFPATELVDGAPQHGGIVNSGSDVSLQSEQRAIYYTLDGSDPQMPGGQIAPGAIPFRESLAVQEGQTIKARVLHLGEWSAVIETSFRLRSDFGLRISEINYHPHRPNLLPGLGEMEAENAAFEFIEFVNTDNAPIHLGGTVLRVGEDALRDGDRFVFADQSLAPGERIVVVPDPSAFQSRYGTDIRIAESQPGRQFDATLSDQGQPITLLDAQGGTIHHFDYDVDGRWPSRANGEGSSLEIVNMNHGYNQPENWQASVDFGGSPGKVGREAHRSIVINEVLPNPEAPEVGFVELYNATAEEIDISNWYLSNSNQKTGY